MKILSNSHLFSDKRIAFIRNLKYFNTGNINVNQGIEKTDAVSDPDAPIEMDNPFQKEKKLCLFCKYDIEPDYKNVRLLSQFQSQFTGRVYSPHITGLCKIQQIRLEREIHKAQHAGLMPYYNKDIRYTEDPKLYNIHRPIKPHKY